VTPDECRLRFGAARRAHLATVDGEGRPHLVPVVFVLAGDTVYHAVDHKPKRTTQLTRLRNIEANPAAALLVDSYDDADWERLWWVRASGRGHLVDAVSAEGHLAVDLLAQRYVQYRERPPSGPVVVVHVDRWFGWSAAP
jgi:PPOX class probable F420-dependent enzyme